MRKFVYKLIIGVSLFICVNAIYAQTNPLYELPGLLPEKNAVIRDNGDFLVGTDSGLYKIASNGTYKVLWNEGKIQHIIRINDKTWYFITDNGILYSNDLSNFEYKNNGLPVLKIKKYDGTETTFEERVHPLKDLSFDPIDQNILATCTKDAVYISMDGGENWKSIGSTSTATSGMKAVAVAHMPVYASDGTFSGTELVAFQSHPIYGFSYYRLEAARPAWKDVSAGFSVLSSNSTVDEISDILPLVCRDESGNVFCDIYCAQSFKPIIYRFNWKSLKAEKIYEGTETVDTIDGLCQSNNLIVYNTLGKIKSYSLKDGVEAELPHKQYENWMRLMHCAEGSINTAYIPTNFTGLNTPLQLSELWMLDVNNVNSPYGEVASDRKAIYVSPYYLRDLRGIESYKKIITENNLDAIVVDMKDDYGLLRFKNVQSELVKEKGKSSSYCVDLEQFVTEFKKDDIYLIARIVVFKDRNLSNYAGGKYAVWNSRTGKPWIGIKGDEPVYDEAGNVTGQQTTYYDENWVDPYSEEVWEYNIAIAQELIERGFDEIQFDYIRFPTDGKNLSSATYRWKSAGMDRESALISFLSYARENINAPIGIDIYGSNGWYRSGSRTGQDVEMMCDYVDVICPMFYPSHFEQTFMDYAPAIERPYRIYFYGSYRNTVLGRNRIVVRPWIQAFYLNVRYDRQYYNADYVKREVFGVRDGLGRGYMYWNNSGRYDDISPDPGMDRSPWYSDEGALQERFPAFSSSGLTFDSFATSELLQQEKLHSQNMLAIWDSVLTKGYNEEVEPSFSLFNWLYIKPFSFLEK